MGSLRKFDKTLNVPGAFGAIERYDGIVRITAVMARCQQMLVPTGMEMG